MKMKNKLFRVLVVDDEPDHREVLELILKEEGCLVDSAASGFDALSKLRDQSYQLVLTDLMMAGMDGLELLKIIKKEYDKIEVMMITGYGTIENAVEAMKKGAYSYFIKGSDPEDLIKEINEIRNRGGEEKEYGSRVGKNLLMLLLCYQPIIKNLLRYWTLPKGHPKVMLTF